MPYTTWGKNRGCCCHMHRSIESAQRCIENDRILFNKSGNEKSDREIREVKSIEELRDYDFKTGPGEPLTNG